MAVEAGGLSAGQDQPNRPIEGATGYPSTRLSRASSGWWHG
eukprot:CAMPEP_0194052270 /NCGR_PEP_ID=MMETSP0009_2-20130614/44720_1 /TAXON_ID=210454 /ORGANISM="Grammatophora oceanica, Strain CCMP 410" /LENGTH=40 /DNA_ID= /DNA_START= /DNA_END= /DNA_ORIENTATION=